MKRLYYLTKDIDVAESVSDRLHEEGITDWHFHVLGKDKANVVQHHLHGATPLQELDIIRSGERGVMGGFLVGLIAVGVVGSMTSFGEQMTLTAQLFAIVLFSLFGAWLGGLVGVSTENYKIKRFHDDIENGEILLMVDVTPDKKRDVQDVMDEFRYVREAGEDSTMVNPFESAVLSK